MIEEKFRKIYFKLCNGENNLIDVMEKIIIEMDKKNEKYVRNKKYTIQDYVCGIIEVISNNISWRKYQGKINGRVLNNKHNYYAKIGVYDKLFRTNIEKYLKNTKGKTTKELSMDSSFVTNKYGKENIGRNIYYKNKRGRKITVITDTKGIPIIVSLNEGNKHDAKIAKEVLKEIPNNESKEEKVIMADKAYDSKEIRKIIKTKKYKPIIPKRKYKGSKRRSLKKKEIKRYRKRIIVENFFAWIKMYPKIDKIYEKTVKSYWGLLLLSISMLIYKRIS